MFYFSQKESKGVDEDGDQEHRCDRKVLQWQNHRRVRHGGVGRRADRPEDPASKWAQRGHRRNCQSSEENVRLFDNQKAAFMFTVLCLFACAPHWTHLHTSLFYCQSTCLDTYLLQSFSTNTCSKPRERETEVKYLQMIFSYWTFLEYKMGGGFCISWIQ